MEILNNTFARSIRDHLAALRESGESPEELCIATGYFNAAGWLNFPMGQYMLLASFLTLTLNIQHLYSNVKKKMPWGEIYF